MDSSNMARPSLPPIHSLDMDKYHREEVDYRRHTDAPLPAHLTTAATAPSSYPSGPPPPYSAASHAPTMTATHGISSDRRLYATDERELNRQPSKHSLPSLHEALGVEQHSTTSTSDSARPPLSVEIPHPTVYAPAPAPVPASTQTPYSRSHRGSISYERRSSDHDMSSSYGRHYPQQSPTSAPSQRETHPYSPSERHRQFDRPPPPPPSSNFSFGYAPYPPRFSSTTSAAPPQPSQATSLLHAPSSAPIYQPSVSHPPPASQSAWRHDMAASHSSRAAGAPEAATPAYGESVKRHLDMYDFEQALSEILDNSTVMCDFSRGYGARLHQNARAGPAPGMLPAITEVEELMNKSRFTLEALGRMREALVAQEAAYLQQAQEQRFQSEAEAKRNDSVHISEEGQGGFAGPEPKKRRGRAAAPGRCHSCNRAETPEWRRGPDGARTLCNACGLHYAKLTRKAGANKAAIGSSNLRPKSGEDLAGSQ